MRIISGLAKNMRLATPPAKTMSIRPTSDRSREALFSILADRLAGSCVLDLFAGTGALGLEALSRGAAMAVFVDMAPLSLELLKKNVAGFRQRITDEERDIRIIKADIRKDLKILQDKLPNQQFNLIFLDPPYDKGLALSTLKALDLSDLPARDGLIIAEERTTTNLPESLGNLTLQDNRSYGDTGFWIYRKYQP